PGLSPSQPQPRPFGSGQATASASASSPSSSPSSSPTAGSAGRGTSGAEGDGEAAGVGPAEVSEHRQRRVGGNAGGPGSPGVSEGAGWRREAGPGAGTRDRPGPRVDGLHGHATPWPGGRKRLESRILGAESLASRGHAALQEIPGRGVRRLGSVRGALDSWTREP
uniref:Uncharacterized protein LOC110216640 n=1 Tax=Phascolarctos cinereus TaxID=38626 RepID=A0A6P5LF40_PHACI